jgi:hypothetical protein
MSRKLSSLFAVLLALALLGFWWGMVGRVGAATALAAPKEQAAPTSQAPPDGVARQDRSADPSAPAISSITSPSAQCYRPEQHTDVCYIQWNSLEVSATSPEYIISMTVTIDNRIRAYYSGFFQTSMYVPQELYSPGFRVACGPPGASGEPNLGNSYSWIVRARETGGFTSTNYGTVTCPADVVPVTRVNLTGPGTGLKGLPYDFIAASQLTTTLPVTYTWSVSDQTARTVTGGLSSTEAYTWDTPGMKELSVEAANAAGTATVTHLITILNNLYFPVLRR